MDERIAFGDQLLSHKKSKIPYVILYAAVVILTALVLFYFFFGCAIVEGQSMENTITEQARCMLIKRGFSVERGDIITIKHPKPEKKDYMFIKRAIAIGGDKILFVRKDENRYVDLYMCKAGENSFKLVEEPYLKEENMNYAGPNNKFGADVNGKIVPTVAISREKLEAIDITVRNPDQTTKQILENVITVPKDHIYYMGDNRNHSSDSRYYGTCKMSDVSGKVIQIAKKGSMLEDFLNFMFSMK